MLPNKLTLFFDGSCTKPGGIAGYGWKLKAGDKTVASDSGEVCRGPEATNNIGEWGAVREALRYLAAQGWTGELEIKGDSQLVIYQLTGRYKVRKESLMPFHEECKRLLENMDWSASWIPREENQECDDLSKVTRDTGTRKEPVGTTAQNGSGAAESVREHRVPARNIRRKGGSIARHAARPALGEETPEVSFD